MLYCVIIRHVFAAELVNNYHTTFEFAGVLYGQRDCYLSSVAYRLIKNSACEGQNELKSLHFYICMNYE